MIVHVLHKSPPKYYAVFWDGTDTGAKDLLDFIHETRFGDAVRFSIEVTASLEVASKHLRLEQSNQGTIFLAPEQYLIWSPEEGILGVSDDGNASGCHIVDTTDLTPGVDFAKEHPADSIGETLAGPVHG